MRSRRAIFYVYRFAVLSGVVALALLSALTYSAVSKSAPKPDPHKTRAKQHLSNLKLRDRMAQLVMTSVPGKRVTPALTKELHANPYGGIIVFAENYQGPAQLSRFTSDLQKSATTNLLISVDQEGGIVKRIPTIAPFRSHLQLGAANKTGATRNQALTAARQLKQLGITLNLAPVADIDTAPHHVMRERSFGRTAPIVAKHVEAFIRGARSAGGATAVKHYPGFGRAHVNTDDAFASISRNQQQARMDLQPFKRAIAAKTDAVMIAHAIFPQLDKQEPASTSAKIYAQLRENLGFKGVAITDSLHAKGFTTATRSSVPRGCVKTIIAGADIALLTGPLRDARACLQQLALAERRGELSRDRINEAALRVLTLKSRLGLLAD